MKIQMFSWLSLIPFCLTLLHIVSVSSQCLNDQQSILNQLSNTIEFNSSLSTKIVSWNHSTDCCSWKGVNCSTDGHVIGLDLSNESISGGIENSSALFNLQFLQSLNLANNNFNFTQIPPGIGNLTNLAYLNLSSAGFSGQIPQELSNMTRLVTLDLSTLTFPGVRSLILENPNLAMLLQNLKELTELNLDGVNISAQGYYWSKAISSSLSNLKVLSLSNCLLSGPIDASIAKLQSLSVIRLSQNNLSSPVPEFFANFTNLTVLKLSYCHLYGQFPGKILQVPTLETLDLSNNGLLYGFLPTFPQNGSLQTLVLGLTNFSRALPDSISNLRMLSRLELPSTNFSGQIPHSMASLTQLVFLDLSLNQFAGPIPSFQKSKNLTHLDLSRNGLSGPIPSTYFEGLVNLAHVDLGFNAFNGSIPPSLFALPSLQNIRLSNNNFHGLLANFSNAPSSLLETLDLSSNRLEGPIPESFFYLRRLKILSLSNNHLNGTAELEAFRGLGNLTTLDLSYNNLSIETRGENSSLSAVPQFSTLKLAFCKLQYFPNLKNHSKLIYLDLSNNQIHGEIPSWIWKVGNGLLIHLNLSHNLLVNFQQPYEISPTLTVLDLHSNLLQGKIPISTQCTATYLDYSANQFNSSLPVDIGNCLTFTYFFSVSNNNITGIIPKSICTATYLKVLDLSNNHLSGTIPECLVQLTGSLGVLNLGKNNFSGYIPGTFPSDCGLETLDLHGNRLEGRVPMSLANCTMLEVLNLGNNMINDTFPCFLKSNTNLRVLVLRSNKLQGEIGCKGDSNIWPKLQIIDIASNYFTGDVPQKCFLNWGNMMIDEDDAQSKLRHLRFQVLQLNQFYYLDTVTVTIKGLERELVKILTVFTSIDISSNRFSGEIPDTIGNLKALYVLNVSNNAFTGSIPPSIGNLRQLGSLDLSVNNLSGRIPIGLASLTFLSFLNLSYNQLEGLIPASSQLQTFTETSFEGNKGLCGLQLHSVCSPEVEPTSALDTEEPASMDAFNWHSIFTGLGFGVGAAIVLGPLMFWKQGRDWWHDHTDKLVYVILSPLGYTNWDDVRYEPEENIQEERHDRVEDLEEEDGLKGKSFQGRYCVFCTKLDIHRKQAIHNFKCSCHNSTPVFSSSSSSSSSYSDSPFSKS